MRRATRRSGPIAMWLIAIFLLTGCVANPPQQPTQAAQPSIHRFDLSAQQRLRDPAGALSVRKHGADTRIRLVAGERVEIFAAGSARAANGLALGPGGAASCAGQPISDLPCNAIIYSIGLVGQAGKVGSHASFTVQQEGNLYLGLNSAHPEQNAGAFHITVLTIPIGRFAGMWVTPDANFIVQGESVDLAVRAFAQHTSISHVEFTAAMPGASPETICDSQIAKDDTFTCHWSMQWQGSYLRNGPITFGFILHGKDEVKSTNPDGTRQGNAWYIRTENTLNYAGYMAYDLNQDLKQALKQGVKYQKVSAKWTIPLAHCLAGENSLSSVWAGMTGITDKSEIAQLGTSSDCVGGVPDYSMWWEMYPEPSVRTSRPVEPGDTMLAAVIFQNGKFQLQIANLSQRWHFETIQPGVEADTLIAECITEPPALVNTVTNEEHIARLTNFGRVSIICQLNNGKPISNGPQNTLYQMKERDVTRAITSPLGSDGATFSVEWKHG